MVVFNSSGNYLRIDDVSEGDIVTIKNEGTWQESKYKYDDGNPKQDFVMDVEHKGEDKVIRINKFSRDEIIPVFGLDTKEWVGKRVKITIENYRSLGKKGMVFVPVKEVDVKSDVAWDEEKK